VSIFSSAYLEKQVKPFTIWFKPFFPVLWTHLNFLKSVFASAILPLIDGFFLPLTSDPGEGRTTLCPSGSLEMVKAYLLMKILCSVPTPVTRTESGSPPLLSKPLWVCFLLLFI
jgi:hypothetical protein